MICIFLPDSIDFSPKNRYTIPRVLCVVPNAQRAQGGIAMHDSPGSVVTQLCSGLQLYSAERRIADCILADVKWASVATSAELAKASHSSEATVTRLCHKLGYANYRKFQLELARDVLEQQETEARKRPPNDPLHQALLDLQNNRQEEVQATIQALNLVQLRKVLSILRAAEIIEIESSSNRYSVDGYEILNEGFYWTEDMTPEIRITLTADDDYYFTALTKDKVTLKGGAEFKKSTRQQSSSVLLLDVTLSSLQNSLKDMEGITLSDNGIATWPAISTAGSYEVRVYREGKIVGTSLETNTNSANCRERMMKPNETYMVKVRAVNKYDPTVKGDWTESNSVYISGEKVSTV